MTSTGFSILNNNQKGNASILSTPVTAQDIAAGFGSSTVMNSRMSVDSEALDSLRSSPLLTGVGETFSGSEGFSPMSVTASDVKETKRGKPSGITI